ncbi:MAG TPA: amino acid permease [Steroidobacteraceae bacterium]|nr:amino acid permease [Steroidobacteraceae bacterium]
MNTLRGWLHRKPIADAVRELDGESGAPTLRRVLGPLDLVLVGIGVIVGGAIFVVTGNAAAQFAGPAIVLSFLLAGVGCALVGMCYAELAAMIPAAGSAYAYTYTALGEAAAWIVGWNLLLEYVFAASYVSVGWSGYLVSLFAQWGVIAPASLTTAPFAIGPHGVTTTGSLINGPAFLLAVAISLIAMRGVRLSSILNGIIVAVKMGALILLVTFGSFHVHPQNWTPFLPANEGFGHFGWSGVLRAAAVVFVSYLGFDAIATLAQDTRNPQRNLPIGILGSLGAVSLLYVAVSLVLTGLVSYTLLDAPNPLSVAVRGGGPSLAWLLPIVDLAAVIGLGSVVLVVMLAQPRVLMAMGKDGLVPPAFSRVHARFRTPYWGTVICGLSVATLAGLFPISILVQLVSVGTLIVFVAVALSVIVLRRIDPDRPRPFRTPFVPLVPIAGILVCAGLLVGIPQRTWAVYLIWLALGLSIYITYGWRSSIRLRASAAAAAAAAR